MVLDNGAIYMMDIQNFIGKTTTEADHQKRIEIELLTKSKIFINTDKCRQKSDKSPPESEIRDKN